MVATTNQPQHVWKPISAFNSACERCGQGMWTGMTTRYGTPCPAGYPPPPRDAHGIRYGVAVMDSRETWPTRARGTYACDHRGRGVPRHPADTSLTGLPCPRGRTIKLGDVYLSCAYEPYTNDAKLSLPCAVEMDKAIRERSDGRHWLVSVGHDPALRMGKKASW